MKTKNKRTKFGITKKEEAQNILKSCIVKYFNDENYGRSDTWNETIYRYRVYKAFDKFFWKRDGAFDMNFAVSELRKILPQMKKLVKYTNDGSTAYGAGPEDYGNLCYVSDRWFCEGRLKFLIDLAERNWTYEQVPEKEYPDQTTWVKKEIK